MNVHPGSAVAVERALGDIELQNVDFRYMSAPGAALLAVSVKIPCGTRVGIVGHEGAGKHTLIRLITRTCEPTHGALLLDGIDICRYSRASFERQFSIIDQEPQILAASVAANIALDRPNASHEEVIQAARRAGLHEFICTLQLGYETPVGQNGVRMPRIRRQQIVIARALLKDPPIVIHDELAGAKLDLEFQRGIENLARGRTFLTIAHSMATLERCELVLVLSDGHVTAIPKKPRSIDAELKAIAAIQGPQLVRHKSNR